MINSVAALREKLHFRKDQLWKDKAKVQEMGADLKVRFESLELPMDEMERSRKEQLEKYYPNLICTQSLRHVNIDRDRHDMGFRGQNQALKLKVNKYYTLTQKVLEVLKNLPGRSIQVIVVSERILGLGDLGVWEFQLGNSLYIPHLEELGLLCLLRWTNQAPIDAGRDVGPSMSYTGGGDGHCVYGRNARYYTSGAGAYSVGAYGECYLSGYWVGGFS
ncbi:DOG1 domain-containing protein [Tanacetum coccineum]